MNSRTWWATFRGVFSLAALACLAASGATFNVNSTADASGNCPVGGTCTLRAAVQAANATPGANTINVPAGTYLLSQSSVCVNRTFGDPNLHSNSVFPLCITGQVTINGAGAGLTIIDAQGLDRILYVSADGNAQVSGVTMQNGSMGTNSYPGGGAGGGGAIHNAGVLTLTNCVLANNTSVIGGGAIFTPSALTVSGCSFTNNRAASNLGGGGAIDAESGNVTVAYSTFHNNFADGGGGAIVNNSAALSVTSSTFDANTAGGAGGGIWNGSGTLVLVNVTISGNSASGTGGGVNNFGTATANNVTLTLNGAGNYGGGTYTPGRFTIRNSILSGNTTATSGPDCLGTLISQGYNLLQNTASCSFSGDGTGNLTGVDPLLSSLLDNGGTTLTHGISAASPALDAGSPAAPGAGNSACALADQRGILRPLGSRCDMGAFERNAALSISGMSPNHAANTDVVQTFARGGGFAAGTTVILRKSGQADIGGTAVYVDPGGAALAAVFDLTAAAPGQWDVVVTNADQTTKTLVGGFTVDVTATPQLWSGIEGPSSVRPGRTATFNFLYGNKGNAAAEVVPLTFSVPAGFGLQAYFPVTPPPAQPGQAALDWTTVPIDILMPQTGVTNVALLLPIVPAGFSGSLQFSIVAPAGLTNTGFPITAPLGIPLLNPNPDPNALAHLAAGAQSYALASLGVAIPNSHLPAMSQYAVNQLNLAVAAGRDAIGSSLGGQPLVYSSAQFLVDIAKFGAANAANLPHDNLPKAPAPSALTSLNNKALKPRAGGGATGGININFHCDGNYLVTTVNGYSTSTYSLACVASQYGLPHISPDSLPAASCAYLANHTLSADGKRCVPDNSTTDCSNLAIAAFFDLYAQPDCKTIPIKDSTDPNDKTGPPGAGSLASVPGGASFPYTIQFENIATATAPAQTVSVTDQLDATTLDLSTFSLGSISFGNYMLTPPAGSKQYNAALDLRPTQNIIVAINAGLNQASGLVTWTFTSLDPATQQLTTDPLAGFLPPNVTQPQGEGKLLYTVAPLPNLATGTKICNQATVVFDVNAPIKTPNWCNTVDVTAPISHVQSLQATQSTASFPVQWSGTDAGSGIRDYTIYASDNGGAFTVFQTQTSATQATFSGAPGHSYGFYSVAEDAVLNGEPAKTAAEATTVIPPCASDGTAQFTITRSGFRLNTTTHQYQQTVTLLNKTAQSLTGPFALVLDGISTGSSLFGPAGTTSCSAPSGSPYVVIPPPSGNNWNVGQSVTVGLNFTDPSNAAIVYTPRILAGTPIR